MTPSARSALGLRRVTFAMPSGGLSLWLADHFDLVPIDPVAPVAGEVLQLQVDRLARIACQIDSIEQTNGIFELHFGKIGFRG